MRSDQMEFSFVVIISLLFEAMGRCSNLTRVPVDDLEAAVSVITLFAHF